MPFTALLVVFFTIVAVIGDQGLFKPVIAGVLIHAGALMLMNGMALATSRMLDARRSLAVGLAVVAALAAEAMPQIAGWVPAGLQSLVSATALGTLVAIGLNALLRLGVPEADFTTPDGRRFLQYERLGIRSPQPAPTIGFGVGGVGWRGGTGVGFGTAWPVYAPPPECRVTFEMRAGRVAGFTRAGTGCVAAPPD